MQAAVSPSESILWHCSSSPWRLLRVYAGAMWKCCVRVLSWQRCALRRMRHPKGIAELEAQLARHFRLPEEPPCGSANSFQNYIYLTQVSLNSLLSALLALLQRMRNFVM